MIDESDSEEEDVDVPSLSDRRPADDARGRLVWGLPADDGNEPVQHTQPPPAVGPSPAHHLGALRDRSAAPPSLFKRFLGYLERQFELAVSGRSRTERPREISDLELQVQELQVRRQLRGLALSEPQMSAVNVMRLGCGCRVHQEDTTQLCQLKLSVELSSLSWEGTVDAAPPGLVGLEQIIDIGVMSSGGAFRPWRLLTPELRAEDDHAALKRLVEASTLEQALAPPPTRAPTAAPTAAPTDRKRAMLGWTTMRAAGGNPLQKKANGSSRALLATESGKTSARRGSTSDRMARRRSSVGRRGGLDDRKLVHGRLHIKYRTLPQQGESSLLFDLGDYDALATWLVGLEALVRSYVDVLECRALRPSIVPWLRGVFSSVVAMELKGAAGIGARSFPVVLLLAASNVMVASEEETAIFLRDFWATKGREIDERQMAQLMRARVSFGDFQQMMAHLIVDKRMALTFRQHSAERRRLELTTGGGKMSLDEWLHFQREVQHDDDRAKQEEIFTGVAGSSGGGITQLQFQWMMLDDAHNSAIDMNRLNGGEEHDLDQPIGHYFCSCSHNTFLDGDQLHSHSTPDM